MSRGTVGVAATTLLLCAGTPARAADTIETYEVGVSDLELYAGYDGLGHEFSDHSLLGDFVLGVGIIERLSLYLGTTVQGYRRMRAGDATVNMGLLGTVLDTRHVDLDLILGVGLGGPGFRGFSLAPAFELNLDRAPDLQAYGLYLRGAAVIHVATVDPLEGEPSTFVHHYVATLGAYLTLAERHQLLVELDGAYHPTTLTGERSFELGGLALGYNVALHRRVELITQVCVNLPQGREKTVAGLMIGLIITLPRPRR